jgi:hypothetical protein
LFTVEWLKDGKIVRREAVLGANLADVLKGARTDIAKAKEASGVAPDTIRVTDHMTNMTMLERCTNR